MANGTTFIIGLTCGALAGAAVALLYAPATGTVTRRELRRRADRFSKRANRFYRDASEVASDLAEGGADLLDQMKDAGSRLVEAARG
jgi:gas vesicle protein